MIETTDIPVIQLDSAMTQLYSYNDCVERHFCLCTECEEGMMPREVVVGVDEEFGPQIDVDWDRCASCDGRGISEANETADVAPVMVILVQRQRHYWYANESIDELGWLRKILPEEYNRPNMDLSPIDAAIMRLSLDDDDDDDDDIPF